jgi:hypothetical protein
LHYRREGSGYVLYSVGVNGADDGGQDSNTDPTSGADDIVVRTPRPSK